MLALLAASIVASGQTFTCTPTHVWDGDGPVWCAEGPHLRIAGIAGRVRQCGVELGVASGLHFQAALGVICSGCASSIIGVARAAMPSICM